MRKITKYSTAIIMVTALLVLWISTTIILRYTMPEYYFSTSHIIPLVFFVFSALFALLSTRWEKKLAKHTITLSQVFNYFLMWKMSKMLVGVILVFCCQIIDAMAFRILLILFALFYIVFMILETNVLRNIERRYKQSET